ncbi:MAG: hypothetical protein ABI781_00655 [Burkholderiales bacterium]
MASNRLARLQAFTGIDFHVAITLLFRVWGIVAGGVMVFVIPATLSPQQQGYYFTFASLLGLQIFFELGLNQVVVQLVSHEMAFLSWGARGELVGEVGHLDRLKSIVALLRRWYAVAATLFLLVAAMAGALLFDRTGSLPRQLWLGPWLSLVSMTAINLYFSPMLAVVEGCGRVGQVARLRLAQSMIGYGLTWAALIAGLGLWAIPLSAATAGLCTALWLRLDNHLLRAFEITTPLPHGSGVDWRREVLPFQWRIAVSWISGYLIFQLFTPLVFVNLGPVAAGRLGIALAIFNALMSVGVSWINAKIPSLTAHVTRGERAELNRNFGSVARRSAAFTIASSMTVLLVVYLLDASGVPHVDRIADLPTLACIAISTSATILIYAAASYMRAHREEPMLAVSVVGGLITLVAAYFASRHGTFATMLVQTAITLVISVPWTLQLFLRYYRRVAA